MRDYCVYLGLRQCGLGKRNQRRSLRRLGNSLMRANKMKWNVEKLDSLFDQKPTAPILKIPIPRMLMLDKLALREGGGGVEEYTGCSKIIVLT